MLDRSLVLADTPLPEGRHDTIARARTLAQRLSSGAELADAGGEVTSEAWQALQTSGLLLDPFPVRFGGAGLSTDEHHLDLFAVLRIIGAADLSMARLFEGHVNAVSLVNRYGTRNQLHDFAAAVRHGTLSGVWGAEGARGVTAAPVDGGWRLDGSKILASGAGLISRPLVPVATEGGQVLTLLTLAPGTNVDLSGWTAQGMRSSATGSVDLTGLMVSDDQIIGSPGDFMRQPAFSGGAWRFCAVHLGAAERLVDLFREHLRTTRREQDPFQLQRIAQATAATTTARFWIAEAARRLADDTTPSDDVVAFANLTRMVTERAALDVLELVHRGVGLRAFLRPNPIERISRDLATYLRQPVPDLAMADAARTILASAWDTADLWAGRA